MSSGSYIPRDSVGKHNCGALKVGSGVYHDFLANYYFGGAEQLQLWNLTPQ